MFGLDPLYTPERQVTGTEVAVFDTNKGIIKVQLDGKGAPIHVANFCELAESGFSADTKFHRLVPGFVVPLLWLVLKIQTPQVLSSISVLVHSMAWILGTPYLAQLSREWMSFPS